MNSYEKKMNILMFIIWVIAMLSTFGSLFFSLVLEYPPCDLCWYQRIFIYPWCMIMLIAMLKKDYSIGIYVFFTSILGAVVALYHSIMSWFPNVKMSTGCGIIPCDTAIINWFGFITLPFLSFVSFVIILICSFLMMRIKKVGE